MTNHDSLTACSLILVAPFSIFSDWNFSTTFSHRHWMQRFRPGIVKPTFSMFHVAKFLISVEILICESLLFTFSKLSKSNIPVAPSLDQNSGHSVSRISKWHFCVFRYFPRPPQTKPPYFLNQREKTLLLVYSLPCSTNFHYVFYFEKKQ